MSSRRSRSAGTRMGKTLTRKYRSWRKRPAPTSSFRGWLLARIRRTSTSMALTPPRRIRRLSWMNCSSRVCASRLVLLISSRNRVPPWASSSRPDLRAVAPEKAPFSKPNSSDSIRVGGRAPQLRVRKGPSRRPDKQWMWAATTPLPAPVSPSSSTGSSLSATCAASCRQRFIAGAWLSMSGGAPRVASCAESWSMRRRCARVSRKRLRSSAGRPVPGV